MWLRGAEHYTVEGVVRFMGGHSLWVARWRLKNASLQEVLGLILYQGNVLESSQKRGKWKLTAYPDTVLNELKIQSCQVQCIDVISYKYSCTICVAHCTKRDQIMLIGWGYLIIFLDHNLYNVGDYIT